MVRMRSPVRIRVAAPDNPEAIASGLWFFIGFCGTLVGVLFLFGVILSCYRYGTGDGHDYPSGSSLSRRVHRTLHSPNLNVLIFKLIKVSFGVIGSCYSRFGTRSVTCHGIRFAYPARRSTSSLVRRRAWVSSPSANTRVLQISRCGSGQSRS